MATMNDVLCGAALGALAGVTGCALEQPTADDVELAKVDQAMPWRDNDAPSIFANDLNVKLAELPLQGEAELIPWAGNYWPTYLDSINHRWNGDDTQSPAAKYGQAFGVDGAEDAVSRSNGIDSQTSRKECTKDDECNGALGEACAKRTGKETGRCVATWFGICHAWAPAAIMYREPKHEVVRNGVTFKVNDVKALLTLAHDQGLKNKFASGRCNANDGQGEIQYDEFGRPRADQCIDTNPASYHILLANFLGLRKQAFVEDRTYDFEVWNQPLRGYRVTKLAEVSAQEANRLVGVKPEGGVASQEKLTVEAGAWRHFGPYAVTPGTSLRAALSGAGDVDLYVRFGAQPDDRAYDCRPYEGSSNETCDLTVPADASQAFVSLRGYGAPAEVTLDLNNGGSVPATYRFNERAVKFYDVRTEVDYISESPASRDGNLGASIDRYTHQDRYTYVLEVDAEGRLLGGEWTGASKRSHVDFVWLPTEVTDHRIAGGKLKLAEIMGLYYESLRDTPETVEQKSGTVARRTWQHFGPFTAPQGLPVRVTMTGSGDADLYVKKGAQPTSASYDCRPYANGSAESCQVVGNGPVYVSVYGYAATSNFQLEVRY